MSTPVAQGPQTQDGEATHCRRPVRRCGARVLVCSAATCPASQVGCPWDESQRTEAKGAAAGRHNKWLECSTHLHLHGPGGSALGPDSDVAPGLTIWEIHENNQLHLQLWSLSPHGSTVLMKLVLFKERTFGFTGYGTPRYLNGSLLQEAAFNLFSPHGFFLRIYLHYSFPSSKAACFQFSSH